MEVVAPRVALGEVEPCLFNINGPCVRLLLISTRSEVALSQLWEQEDAPISTVEIKWSLAWSLFRHICHKKCAQMEKSLLMFLICVHK